MLSSAHSCTRPEVKQRTLTSRTGFWDSYSKDKVSHGWRSSECSTDQHTQWVDQRAKGLQRFHVCGHLDHHPIIKVPSKPQTPPPFLSPLMWRFHLTACTLPVTVILGQTSQRRRFVSLKTPHINHIKSPGNKSAGWQHQTNTPISHCAFFYVDHIVAEGGVVYSGISHTVKAKRTYRLAHSASMEISGPLCRQLQ